MLQYSLRITGPISTPKLFRWGKTKMLWLAEVEFQVSWVPVSAFSIMLLPLADSRRHGPQEVDRTPTDVRPHPQKLCLMATDPADVVQSRTSDGECLVDYPGGPNLITWVHRWKEPLPEESASQAPWRWRWREQDQRDAALLVLTVEEGAVSQDAAGLQKLEKTRKTLEPPERSATLPTASHEPSESVWDSSPTELQDNTCVHHCGCGSTLQEWRKPVRGSPEKLTARQVTADFPLTFLDGTKFHSRFLRQILASDQSHWNYKGPWVCLQWLFFFPGSRNRLEARWPAADHITRSTRLRTEDSLLLNSKFNHSLHHTVCLLVPFIYSTT